MGSNREVRLYHACPSCGVKHGAEPHKRACELYGTMEIGWAVEPRQRPKLVASNGAVLNKENPDK